MLDAARSGRRLTAAELADYGRSGERAAESGVALRGLVDLFLSATWRLWRELPGDGDSPVVLRAAGLAVLRAADDAVAAAAEGFERAYLSVARRDEAERREFFDDLLSGRGSVGDVMVRGERLGLRLAGPHYVLLAGPAAPGDAATPAGMEIDAAVADAAAPSPSLVVSRHGRLVVIVGAVGGGEAPGWLVRCPAALHRRTADSRAGRGDPVTAAGQPPPWRIAFGRPYPGPSGVVHSYDEAADAFDVAQRLGLPEPVVSAADLLIYQVLLRDRAAITDLVRTLLRPAGAGPRRGGTAAGHPGGLLRLRRRRHRGRAGPAPVGADRHLPAGQGQGADRARSGPARRRARPARGGHRRAGTGLASYPAGARVTRPSAARPRRSSGRAAEPVSPGRAGR